MQPSLISHGRSPISFAVVLFSFAAAAQIPLATDAPDPLSPEEAIAAFQLPDDLRIEIVASEPDIKEPGTMAFDEFGRIYVGELHGYNLEGYYDIVELNKTGDLDREVRRVRVEGPSLERARNEAVGAIKRLEDKDGDGRFETALLWADDLPPCYGLVRAREGFIAVCPPKIFYLADRNNDGSAETREILYEGFRFDVLERGINSARRGVDNWIYIAAGGGGGEITGPHLANPVRIGHTDFRIRDDGTAIEPVTGTCGTFGLALTEFGDRFIASTNRHALYSVPLEHRHLVRNPHVSTPGGDVDAAGYDRIFPTSDPDPWRAKRNEDPAWVKFYGQRETYPNGYFTSACGPHVYLGGSLPGSYVGQHFGCAPANNLVTRGDLTRDGAGYRVTRVPGEEESDFLTSTDRWFRPINIERGPDGAMYIVDFYREIIEDYSAIPRHLQQRYINSLRAGYEHGRIWRITAKDAPPYTPTLLADATPQQLVGALQRSNPWTREMAQQLIINGNDEEAVRSVRKVSWEAQLSITRLHALYTLDALSDLTPKDVEKALRDSSYGVRLHALRLAERWLDESRPVRDAAVRLAADADASVRLQAAQSLGASTHEEAIDALAKLAADHSGDRWMTAAIVSSAADDPVALAERILEQPHVAPEAHDCLSLLATTAARKDDSGDDVARLLNIAAAQDDANAIALLDGLAEGLQDSRTNAAARSASYPGLMQMLSESSNDVRGRALQVAGLLNLGDSPAMQRAWEQAGRDALDENLDPASRTAAANLLAAAPWEFASTVAPALDPRSPLDLQLAAVNVLARGDDASVPKLLLKQYSALTPRVQEKVLDVLLSGERFMPAVIDALENRVLLANAIPPIRRLQLIERGTPEMRARAAKLLESAQTSSRAAVIEQYEPALSLNRSADRGKVIFEEKCVICHRLRGVGNEVGPDLSAVRTRPDATLLADIIDPSGIVADGYTAYLIETDDGDLYTGTLAEETATSINLYMANGEKQTVLRNRLLEMRTSPLSLMPEGLEEDLTHQDMADLLGYLRDAGGQYAQTGVVLFEDESEFADALTQGGGDLALDTDQPYSGERCLRVTPLQRHSPRIEGWNYRIVESPNPAPDGEAIEVRYLRLAWKTEGDGVMIELAASGGWPPSDSPTRRYYSGANTTDWQATRVSETAPKDWAVVTVDLWKDFGEFTLTGIAPTALGGPAYFDRIELMATLDAVE